MEASVTRGEVAEPGALGEIRLVTSAEAVRLRGALEAARLLVVSVGDVGVGHRGKLAEAIDDAIELALHTRGGASPGIASGADPEATLSDQLYRARQIGRVGVALDLGVLTALCDARGALEPEDAACVRFLARASRDRPLVFLLDSANTRVSLYGAPVPLVEALGIAAPRTPLTPTSAVTIAKPSAPSRGDPRVGESPAMPASSPKPPSLEPSIAQKLERIEKEEEPSPASLTHAAELLAETTRATPLVAFERAFVEGYAPLRTALVEDRLAHSIGKSDARARLQSFAATFARAYGEALPTFGATRRQGRGALSGQGPRMILDAFDLAHRAARVHGARSIQLVVVDALRWDLGRKIRHRLGAILARRAVCVEDHVLWSLLPTTSAVQLDALARGEDALRSPPASEREPAIHRGRSLDVLRRMRVGHRDLFKLDLLEARLRDAGPREPERLDALSRELAPVLARHIDQAAMRTLVVVLGDHGFVLEESAEGTGPAKQGGASPDEVFVPFTAWLVGGVH